MMPEKPPLTIDKLSDSFGQYTILLRCQCGHTRKVMPKTFADMAGSWEVRLSDVVKRCRCSKCDKKTVKAEVFRLSPYDKE